MFSLLIFHCICSEIVSWLQGVVHAPAAAAATRTQLEKHNLTIWHVLHSGEW